MKKKAHIPYSHDITHCGIKECKKYSKCYRAWLNEHLLEHGWTTAWYFRPEVIGKECEYYLDIKNYKYYIKKEKNEDSKTS